MKNIICSAIFTLCFINIQAQEKLDFSGKKLIVSPEINADNTVTFRLVAPNAKTVKIQGNWMTSKEWAPGVADMIKADNGLWQYTTPVLPSDLYTYSFIVDGLTINDPNNVYLIRDVATVTNVFIVGNGRGDLYKVNNVPHGTVARCWYNSPTLAMQRRITIYTPPGYEANNNKYPVLYLLHGMGGDENAWIELGRTAQILDNLIAQGKAQPMIVVMPNGNAVQEAAPGESSLGFYKPEMQLPKTMEGTIETSFPDIIKFVETNYRTIQKKSGRAIAGLSMGGFHSLHISKQYPDLFDYVGLFSAAILPSNNTPSPIYANFEQKLKTQFDKKPKLYWIGIGSSDFLYKANEEYRKILDKNNFKYTYYETGDGHVWKNWRIYLSEFATLLFR